MTRLIGSSSRLSPFTVTADIGAYISSLERLLEKLDQTAVQQIAGRLRDCKARGRTVYVAGNGGSQANAAHLVLHLQDVGIRAHDLMAGLPSLSAAANDYSYADALRLNLQAQGVPGDTLVVISGSGASANIILVLAEAKRLGIYSIGLFGFPGSAGRLLCDLAIETGGDAYGPVEDTHSAIIHLLQKLLA